MSLPTQATVNSKVDAIVKQYNGQVCDAGADTKAECTAPPIKLVQALGAPVPAMANDRADGWGTNFPASLAPFFTHEAFSPGKKYPKGTIMMWNSPHIVFLTANSDGSNTVPVFEQNADPDGAKCHTFNRTVNNQFHAATYVLIPNVAVASVPVAKPIAKPSTTQTITLPKTTGPWHLRDKNSFNKVLGVIDPRVFKRDLTYTILGHPSQYLYTIQSEDYGVGNIDVQGSDVIIK